MNSKEPKLTFSIEPFPVIDLTGDDKVPTPPIKEEKELSQPECDDPPMKPLQYPDPVWVTPPADSVPVAPPQDPEMAWVIVQSLGTAFAIGGLVGALLAYSFSKNSIVGDD